jgi:virginiamycin B lyase
LEDRCLLSGAFAEFPVPTPGAVPYGITAGPDGSVWFAEFSPANRIGRVTPSGSLAEYVVPTPNSMPIEVTPRTLRQQGRADHPLRLHRP